VKSGRLTSLAACAFIALMVACLAGAPRGERAVDCEGNDLASAIDVSQALPSNDAQVVTARPVDRSATFVDQPPPCSRLTIAEVFRPPQARK
jgi:hypothetical protein